MCTEYKKCWGEWHEKNWKVEARGEGATMKTRSEDERNDSHYNSNMTNAGAQKKEYSSGEGCGDRGCNNSSSEE